MIDILVQNRKSEFHFTSEGTSQSAHASRHKNSLLFDSYSHLAPGTLKKPIQGVTYSGPKMVDFSILLVGSGGSLPAVAGDILPYLESNLSYLSAL